ncbi:MAG: TetR/AcrR family transcriptional regulator [Actinomycetota bacterium]|nr:TetR/AcrR family transcriptional regulator [Actinomycetota bacterium]
MNPKAEAPNAATAKRAVGRPRHYDEATEREIIVDAAYTVLRDRGDKAMTISDILTSAGVSTRSFYRHFGSKDELLCAMYMRDAERAAERMVRRLARAADPRQAVEMWIDEILSYTQVGRKAERVNVLGSILVNRAEGADDVSARGRALLVTPLAEAIAAGAADGTFTSRNPEADADMVTAVVFNSAGLTWPRDLVTPSADARAAMHEFCLRALGAQPTG